MLIAGFRHASIVGVCDRNTSRLLHAEVQFVTEMIIQDVTAPAMLRERAPELYNVPLLQFGQP